MICNANKLCKAFWLLTPNQSSARNCSRTNTAEILLYTQMIRVFNTSYVGKAQAGCRQKCYHYGHKTLQT